MEVFRLIVDEKKTGWRRTYVSVEANSLEEAVEMCKEGTDYLDDIEYSEFLYDTETPVEQSEKEPRTIEVMDRNWNLLFCDDEYTSRR